jgi:MFS family permease
VLVIALLALSFGCAMAALIATLPLMIVPRTIQGAGGAVFPLSFGIIRDEFPKPRIPGAIALISGVFGIGGSLGIVLAGPILDSLSYHSSSGSPAWSRSSRRSRPSS